MSQFTAKVLLYVAAFLWGMGFIGVQEAINVGWEPFAILFMRGSIAGSILLFIAFRHNFPWWKDRRFVYRSILAGLIMSIAFAVQTYGQVYSSISMTSVLTVSYVVITPFAANMIKKQNLSKNVYIGCFIALISVFIISYQGGSWAFGIGEILLLIGAILYALQFLMIESLGNNKVAFALSGIQLIVMAAFSFVMMLITGQTLQIEGIQYTIALAIFCSGLGFYLQVMTQEVVSSSIASFILSLESLFGVLGAVIIMGDVLTWQIGLGCILMLVAIYFVEKKKK